MSNQPLKLTVLLTFGIVACAAEFGAPSAGDRDHTLMHARRYVAVSGERKRAPPARALCGEPPRQQARNVLPYSIAPQERAAKDGTSGRTENANACE